MNRRQRRQDRSAKKIRALQHRVEQTGRPGVIYGLTGACRDCSAVGAIELHPGGQAVPHVFHDDGCPAAAGIVTWSPEPID